MKTKVDAKFVEKRDDEYVLTETDFYIYKRNSYNNEITRVNTSDHDKCIYIIKAIRSKKVVEAKRVTLTYSPHDNVLTLENL